LISRNNVIACAKHYVGDGGTENGKNEGNTISSYEDLERIHMAPYLDCISQGVSTIMASYSSWNGRKLHSDHFLLTEILKEKLGFKVKNPDSIHILQTEKSKFFFFFFYLVNL
jgi:beta-glucosidase